MGGAWPCDPEPGQVCAHPEGFWAVLEGGARKRGVRTTDCSAAPPKFVGANLTLQGSADRVGQGRVEPVHILSPALHPQPGLEEGGGGGGLPSLSTPGQQEALDIFGSKALDLDWTLLRFYIGQKIWLRLTHKIEIARGSFKDLDLFSFLSFVHIFICIIFCIAFCVP